jgi:hypothetical protein
MSKKRGRDQLAQLSATRPHWMLVWEDECWFSWLAQPNLKAWSQQGKPLTLEQKESSREDQEAKAVACYGAVEE